MTLRAQSAGPGSGNWPHNLQAINFGILASILRIGKSKAPILRLDTVLRYVSDHEQEASYNPLHHKRLGCGNAYTGPCRLRCVRLLDIRRNCSERFSGSGLRQVRSD